MPTSEDNCRWVRNKVAERFTEADVEGIYREAVVRYYARLAPQDKIDSLFRGITSMLNTTREDR